jgi:transposase
MERLISENQELAFRLVHHDHQGLNQLQAAAILEVDQATISRWLARVEEVLPQFFPILSQQEAKCYHHLTVDGWSPSAIAEHLDMTTHAVYMTFQRCKGKGLSFPGPHGKVLRYDESMDDQVITKF